MFNPFHSLIDANAKDIKRYQKVVDQINGLEPSMQALDDNALSAKTAEFKERLANGETLNDILPEAFAVVREASRRVLGMRHFDVQLIGGMALHDGRIAEMKTGEGKTLVATAPVYLNALTGKGVHVVTVNEYLSGRDGKWMGRLYNFLGLTVGQIYHDMMAPMRKAAYNADITYGTNNEFGFDYLRDNMAVIPEQMVQRPLNYAIVDEVDSILIDEARTPLIISGVAAKPTEMYLSISRAVSRLKPEVDYTVDEKMHAATLTAEGISKMENALGLENLYDDANTEYSHHVNQALKAYALFKRDRDYVVQDGQVIIVDEFTGRLMFGRRYSEGLHQAIEAKEGVKVENETQTLATITFQNYFRMYKKLSGMTGTAATEEDEFRNIYGLDVVVIPTNLPMQRIDYPDLIYRTVPGKFQAVVEEIIERHATGQPVLVGTVSIEKSEMLSDMLKKRGVPHQVLNAKYHEKEAEIVSQAGRPGMVTIATNMAGRGTDIVLGGNAEFLARMELAKKEEYTLEEEQTLINAYKEKTKEDSKKVTELGGLAIIGTERHESRRIDNQLRGRAGRQGDPGSSRFYISMEDDLMRLFGSDSFKGMLDKMGMDDTTPIDSKLVSKSIETAQKRVEGRNFEIRKNVLSYDDVMNQQREIIYGQRHEVLGGEDLAERVSGMIDDVVEKTIAGYSGVSKYPEEWDLTQMLQDCRVFLPENMPEAEELVTLSAEEIIDLFKTRAHAFYAAKEERLGSETMRELERRIILRIVDTKWMDHLDAMDQLRTGIGLRGYGQKDPLMEYKFEAFDMFQQMIDDIQKEVVEFLFRVEVEEAPKERAVVVTQASGGSDEPTQKKPIVKSDQVVGRNDPCPCGSGKKYKKCCGKDK